VRDGDVVLIDRSEVCPRRLVTLRSWYWLELHRHYKNGVLPLAGGLLDQPYSFHRAMAVIDEWEARCARSASQANTHR
jgi:hypothetical protein